MAFVKKEWVDRLTEFAGRRQLTNVLDGTKQTVDVERAEGEELRAGDKINAANMNDLEQRIANEFNTITERDTPMTLAQYTALPTKENRLYFTTE